MNWTFHPKNKEITTSLPLSVEITSWEGRPEVVLDRMGKLELRPTDKGSLKADFHVYLPGTYKLSVKDAVVKEEFTFEALEHRYLGFDEEFGFFFVLFLFVMGGIILWTKKIMTKKTNVK